MLACVDTKEGPASAGPSCQLAHVNTDKTKSCNEKGDAGPRVGTCVTFLRTTSNPARVEILISEAPRVLLTKTIAATHVGANSLSKPTTTTRGSGRLTGQAQSLFSCSCLLLSRSYPDPRCLCALSHRGSAPTGRDTRGRRMGTLHRCRLFTLQFSAKSQPAKTPRNVIRIIPPQHCPNPQDAKDDCGHAKRHNTVPGAECT